MKNDLKINVEILNNLKEKIIDVAKEMFSSGLVVSTFGVVSAKIPNTDYVLITPSGFSKAKLETRNLIIVDLDGKLVEGDDFTVCGINGKTIVKTKISELKKAWQSTFKSV